MALEAAMYATGVEINYYFVCKRKLWYFIHGITMETNSTLVEIGKEVHQSSYQRNKGEIMIDNLICLDFIQKELLINETKLNKSMEEATRYQILYYIYYLEKKGVSGVTGVIRYPKKKQVDKVILNQDDRRELDRAIKAIYAIKNMPVPPQVDKQKKCKKCSYYELCFC